MNEINKRIPIFHVPHDGGAFPVELTAAVCVPGDQFRYYHEKMRDTGTLEMVPPAWGGEDNTVYFPISRLLCDVERFVGPEEPMERLGMGFCYERAFDGTRIKSVTEELKRETLRWYHRHHERLNQMCNTHSKVLLLDLHSFSDDIVPVGRLSRNQKTPDICLGIDERFTPEKLVSAAENCLSAEGYTLARNYPYSGSLVPNAVLNGTSACDCESIMLEWNKRVYCDADGVPEINKIERIRKTITKFIDNYLNGEEKQKNRKKASAERRVDISPIS